MKKFVDFKNLYRYSFLLWLLVRREIVLRYRGSFLGIVWTVLNPLMMMLVMNIVFSYLFRHTIENYLVYYLSGQIVFNLMVEGSSGGLNSIISNAGLINKVYIPKYIFPLSKVLSAGINSLFALVALLVVCLFTGIAITPLFLLIPLLFGFLLLFVYGMSLFFAAIAVQFRDIVPLHHILMTVWMYLTPIFYPITVVPEKYAYLFSLNPMFTFVSMMRGLVLYNQLPHINDVAYVSVFIVVSIFIGGIIFKKKQKTFFLYS